MRRRKIMAALACSVLIGGSVQALAASYGVNVIAGNARSYGEVSAVVPTATATLTSDFGVGPQGVKLTNYHKDIVKTDTSFPVARVSCDTDADDSLEVIYTLRFEGTRDDKIVCVTGTTKGFRLAWATPDAFMTVIGEDIEQQG